ncbi:hypothetical protein D9M71_389510 [compost metagenome]
MQRFQQLGFGQHEAQADTREAEELAEGAQHHQPRQRAVAGQALLRRAVHEGLVHQQPAAPLRQALAPGQQGFRRQALARRVAGIDHQHHVEALQLALGGGGVQLFQFVAFAAPGVGVFGIARRDDPDPAALAQAWQGLDRRLGTGYRQQGGAAVVAARRHFEAVVQFRQPRPGRCRNGRQFPAVGGDTGREVEPVGLGYAVALRSRAQPSAMFKQGASLR